MPVTRIPAHVPTLEAEGYRYFRETLISGSLPDFVTGLIANWPMVEGSGSTVVDAVAANNGTIYGASWSNGRLIFDGINDYVEIADAAILDFAGDVTMSAWVKSLTDGIILSKYDSPADAGFVLSTLSLDGRSGGYYSSGVGSSMADDAWHHIVGGRVGGDWHIYQDGELKSSASGGSGSFANIRKMLMGAYRDAANPISNFFAGIISDVRIYSRALSDPDVLALYNFQKSSYS